jgi:hypothetical protein
MMPRGKHGKVVETASRKGIAHKPDGFTKQDQAGSGKTPEAGHVTEKAKKEPNYSRKRH